MPKCPQRARKVIHCHQCQKEFGQTTNFLLHQGLMHTVDKLGNPTDEATCQCFQTYSKPKQALAYLRQTRHS